MGEAKRRKLLDPDFGKPLEMEIELGEFMNSGVSLKSGERLLKSSRNYGRRGRVSYCDFCELTGETN